MIICIRSEVRSLQTSYLIIVYISHVKIAAAWREIWRRWWKIYIRHTHFKLRIYVCEREPRTGEDEIENLN